MPVYKASALRGGMGSMLMDSYCREDGKCDDCRLERECPVRNIMYSHMKIQPSFMSSGNSVGYVIECEDYHDYFRAGETMNFNVILFGGTTEYTGIIPEALKKLGAAGLGREKARFDVFSKEDTDPEKLHIRTVADYVAYRKEKLAGATDLVLNFKTPLSLKYQNEILKDFSIEALNQSLCRRIYMLDCFEGIESGIHEKKYVYSIPLPGVLSEDRRTVTVKRYSDRRKCSMDLYGIQGKMRLYGVSRELMDILIAGELIHAGKNTSFGFGRYHIEIEDVT
ncbi:MAG: CRISPR system precrRNA processing endoribonuclease RAMP protein Cas6 [Butyrivibrio sp.]|nr:CRISPR system precrRNA processing endoribonuclease RAMP protein Cas6 [Butyrivibrio sp.]